MKTPEEWQELGEAQEEIRRLQNCVAKLNMCVDQQTEALSTVQSTYEGKEFMRNVAAEAMQKSKELRRSLEPEPKHEYWVTIPLVVPVCVTVQAKEEITTDEQAHKLALDVLGDFSVRVSGEGEDLDIYSNVETPVRIVEGDGMDMYLYKTVFEKAN